MKKYPRVLLASLMAVQLDCTMAKNTSQFALEDVQGFCWESCDDLAVQFAIQNDQYSGDFAGDVNVLVERDRLIIELAFVHPEKQEKN